MVPYALAWELDYDGWVYALGICVVSFWSVELLLNFCTGLYHCKPKRSQREFAAHSIFGPPTLVIARTWQAACACLVTDGSCSQSPVAERIGNRSSLMCLMFDGVVSLAASGHYVFVDSNICAATIVRHMLASVGHTHIYNRQRLDILTSSCSLQSEC
eukprot:1987322-Amphidinium_carterae.1